MVKLGIGLLNPNRRVKVEASLGKLILVEINVASIVVAVRVARAKLNRPLEVFQSLQVVTFVVIGEAFIVIMRMDLWSILILLDRSFEVRYSLVVVLVFEI